MTEDSRKADIMAPEPTCPWLDADECALARERSVAGISNDIPACPVHGPHPDMPVNPDSDDESSSG